MNLAMLLVGPGDLHRIRWYVTALGAVLCLTGLFIVIDASDTVTLIALEAFGWVMVVMGLAKMAFSLRAAGGGMPSLFGFQGLVFVLLGIAIANYPQQSVSAVPWLFGLALLLNGLYQALSSLIIRCPNWGWFLTSGVAHLLLGGLLFLEWKKTAAWVVPLFLGTGFLLLGLTTLRTALRLRRYLRRSESDTVRMAVRYFLDFHVPGRFRRQYLPEEPVTLPDCNGDHGDLLVHIWTPTTVAEVDADPNLISRYVAARDAEGNARITASLGLREELSSFILNSYLYSRLR